MEAIPESRGSISGLALTDRIWERGVWYRMVWPSALEESDGSE